jgi:hypothetical protein
MLYKGEMSYSEIQIETEGDGNNTKNTITMKDGQFGFAEVQKTEDGVQLVIYGEWEINELVDALNKHGYKGFGELPEFVPDYESAEMFAEYGDLFINDTWKDKLKRIFKRFKII